MLFATFQQIFEGNFLTGLNPDRYFNEKLGFAPVWAVAVEDYKDAVVSILSAAPNYPDIFYLIETDDYVRIDKVKYYGDLMTNSVTGHKKDKIDTNDYSIYISDSVDNLHSEFLLNADKITSDNIKLAIPVIGLDDKNMLRHVIQFMLRKTNVDIDDQTYYRFLNMIFDCYQRVPRVSPDDVYKHCIDQGFSDVYADHKAFVTNNYLAFLYVFVHWICKVYTVKDADGIILRNYDFEIWLHNASKWNILFSKFTSWSKTDCSLSGYDIIINEMMKQIIDNKDVLDMVFSGDKCKPNDKCPCGSGKKYKKCHGPYIE